MEGERGGARNEGAGSGRGELFMTGEPGEKEEQRVRKHEGNGETVGGEDPGAMREVGERRERDGAVREDGGWWIEKRQG